METEAREVDLRPVKTGRGSVDEDRQLLMLSADCEMARARRACERVREFVEAISFWVLASEEDRVSEGDRQYGYDCGWCYIRCLVVFKIANYILTL